MIIESSETICLTLDVVCKELVIRFVFVDSSKDNGGFKGRTVRLVLKFLVQTIVRLHYSANRVAYFFIFVTTKGGFC